MNYNNFMPDSTYGLECLIDLHGCEPESLSTHSLRDFIGVLLKVADMHPYGELHVWEDHESNEPHIQGNAVFQWITTSHIMVYALTMTNLVMINLFSCKPFNTEEVLQVAADHFKAKGSSMQKVSRGLPQKKS